MNDGICCNSEYGIEQWKCEGNAEEIYNSRGFVGYRKRCSACRVNFDATFDFGKCRDSHCVGDGTIKLSGSQVAGEYRNKSEDASYCFPPIRCRACSTWLKEAKQDKRKCDSCGNTFIYTAGLKKRNKKEVGDPEVNAPRFCPGCASLSASERENKVALRRTKAEAIKRSTTNYRKAQMPKHRVMDSIKGPRRVNEANKLVNIWAKNARTLHVKDETPAIQFMGFELAKDRPAEYKQTAPLTVTSVPTPVKIGDLKGTHPIDHLHQFRPPESLADFQRKNEEVLKSTNKDKVIQLVHTKNSKNPGAIVKIDIETGRCVIARTQPSPGKLSTAFPIFRKDDMSFNTTPAYTLNRIGDKMNRGLWEMV